MLSLPEVTFAESKLIGVGVGETIDLVVEMGAESVCSLYCIMVSAHPEKIQVDQVLIFIEIWG